MPRVLALHPNKYLFNDNVSQPRSNQAWCNLIQVFFQHIRKRYGIEETRTWRYSLWNLPNTASFLYGFDNPEDFQTFYKKYGEKAHGFNRGMNRFEKNTKIQNKRFHFCMSYVTIYT
ncbi:MULTISPECIES: GH39 family glycosyl hydrolase [unclassified Bilifractor]|uniref:GH39 family glycosyl hydrolase n=1 Tax=unclassified Bilifractor TaxID=2815795 RepID=UPI003F903D0D